MRLIRFLIGGPPKKSASRPVSPLSRVNRRYLYLGDEYGVSVRLGQRNSLKVLDGEFEVTLREMSRENFEGYIEGWFRRRARAEFLEAVERWRPLLEALGHQIPRPRLKLFYMKRAWGRCYYTKELITINLHLLKFPRECFDYIVLHELCHFVHQDHSPRFKALMGEVYPQWRETDASMKAFLRARGTILQKLHI